MGIEKNYYTKKMKKFNVSKTSKGFKLTLDYTPLGIKLDKAQDALDAAVWDSVQKRMPVDTGILKNQTDSINASTRGEVYLYPPNSDYGHYQYEGKTMVDPVTGKAFSRPGVEKVYVKDYKGEIPTTAPENLTYGQEKAVPHWGEVAIREDSNKWLEVVKKAIGG